MRRLLHRRRPALFRGPFLSWFLSSIPSCPVSRSAPHSRPQPERPPRHSSACRILPVLAILLLAGCATLAPTPPDALPARSTIGDFSFEGRFALRLERPDGAPESASGRLSWQHDGDGDRILVANPFGQGIAEIAHRDGAAELHTARGESRRAADPAVLLEEATGYALPLGAMPAWLLGRPQAATADLETDRAGRPIRLTDAGWQIHYGYDSDTPEALPSRLTLRRSLADGDLEIRLRIETWRSTP